MKKILIPALLLPSAAFAHAGHIDGNTFFAGLSHPMSGADHVLAMLAVGLWAAGLGGRSVWALPISFVSAMIVGGALGALGIALPMIEPMILASIIVLGAAVGLALRLPLPAMLAAVALFGAAHGFAHGAEGPSTGLALYALGFGAATMALHLLGIAIGRGLPALILRASGAAVATAGLALALA